jgi:hypothetical protein
MCDGCERPSAVWGVDEEGVGVAARVHELLARSSALADPTFRDELADYYTVMTRATAGLPDLPGYGLAAFIGADVHALLETRRLLSARPRRQELSIAVFLGSRADAPDVAPMLAVGDADAAASVIAALSEAVVLGPSQLYAPIRLSELPDRQYAQVISGPLSQGLLAETFSSIGPVGWGVGRARGPTAIRTVVRMALYTPNWPRLPADGRGPQPGIAVARIGAGLDAKLVRFELAMRLTPALTWRMMVISAAGLEADEVELVLVGVEVRRGGD